MIPPKTAAAAISGLSALDTSVSRVLLEELLLLMLSALLFSVVLSSDEIVVLKFSRELLGVLVLKLNRSPIVSESSPDAKSSPPEDSVRLGVHRPDG